MKTILLCLCILGSAFAADSVTVYGPGQVIPTVTAATPETTVVVIQIDTTTEHAAAKLAAQQTGAIKAVILRDYGIAVANRCITALSTAASAVANSDAMLNAAATAAAAQAAAIKSMRPALPDVTQ